MRLVERSPASWQGKGMTVLVRFRWAETEKGDSAYGRFPVDDSQGALAVQAVLPLRVAV